MTNCIKILADGTQVPMTDPRTDHVAVLDTARNLLIHPHSIGVGGKRAPAEKLPAAVAKLDVLGGGWRMASREEAESILDLSCFDPALDPNLFPGIKPDWHVTSTPAAWAPASAAWAPASAAWFVNFSYGYVFDFDLGYEGWALAVRPAGQ